MKKSERVPKTGPVLKFCGILHTIIYKNAFYFPIRSLKSATVLR